ncbi:MAG: pyruvate carboxylase subunit B [Dehalococcoidia bacterium]|nr:MAG: pyruvate carboxylase subunit B [Dehalococcoidia bacterium]
MEKNPLKITDITLRDGHQSLLATRMRTEDMEPIAPEMNKAGFYSMEVWGGATFDVPTRFLNEDPWERLRTLKKLAPNTPLQMLLRGQNLVGYRNYADDVVEAFVKHAAETGIDIFRVFDALNDGRNFQTAVKAIKAAGKHAQLSISYSLTENKMGGPVFNLDYFLKKAVEFQDMGADSLCIKDMAGLISPDDAYTLIKALKEELKIPVNLHSHYTSGMASMSFIKAIEAGVDIIDTAIAPFALRTSHPAIEPIVVALQGTPRDTEMDLKQLLKLGQYFESIAPKYRDFLATTRMAVIDTGVLMHQVPGGMISNLIAQLKEANALNRIDEVYAELPRVRKELGFPPLVTPTSQIVGIQAVQNVLFGRYKVISTQVKDYFYGLYGRPPMPVDPEIQKIALKDYERGETPITQRPGDVLDPELDSAIEATKDIAKDIGDVLIYALYPTTGMRFLRWKYGLEEPPRETKPKTMADIKREDELLAKAKADIMAGKPAAADKPRETTPAEKETKGSGAIEPEVEGTAIKASMPGLIIRFDVKKGDEVKEGDNIVVMEAMKMAIDIVSPVDGIVKSVNFKEGDNVARDDILAIIE